MYIVQFNTQRTMNNAKQYISYNVVSRLTCFYTTMYIAQCTMQYTNYSLQCNVFHAHCTIYDGMKCNALCNAVDNSVVPTIQEFQLTDVPSDCMKADLEKWPSFWSETNFLRPNPEPVNSCIRLCVHTGTVEMALPLALQNTGFNE